MTGAAVTGSHTLLVYKRALGCGYIMAIGVCGMVVVGVDSSLEQLATNCGTTSTKVGTVFIAKGAGTVVGALLSPRLYLSTHGNTALSVGLSIFTAVLLYTPFVSRVATLHLLYFMVGALLDVIMTGCQIMSRKVHGEESGVWIGANLMSLGVSSAIVSVIIFLDDSLFQRYAIMSATSFVVAVFLGVVLRAPEGFGGLLEATSSKGLVGAPARAADSIGNCSWIRRCLLFYRTHYVEINLAGLLFFQVGVKAAVCAYLEAYVEYTGAIADSQETLLLVDFWMTTTFGLAAGILYQQHCSLLSLCQHTATAFVLGGAAGLAVLVFDRSAAVLWVSVGIWGLCSGPTLGYCYELNNRVSAPSGTGLSVITLGLNLGAILISYATSQLLEYTGSGRSFTAIVVLSFLVPYPLLLNVRRTVESRKGARGGFAEGLVPAAVSFEGDEGMWLLR